jgi:hypothetical protein
MTTTATTEQGQVCVFVAVDHCTSERIGIHASLSGVAVHTPRHEEKKSKYSSDRQRKCAETAKGLFKRLRSGSAAAPEISEPKSRDKQEAIA